MRPFLTFLLLSLGALTASAQTYFNQRHAQIIPGAQLQYRCIVPTDSGYTVAGIAYDNPTPSANAIVLSFLDATGRLRRSHYFGQTNYVYFCGLSGALQRLPDGGYLLVGNRVAPVIPRLGATMIWRFNAQGDTLWTRVFRTMAYGEGAMAVQVLPDGDLLLVGLGGVLSNGFTQMLLTRTDAQGNIKWRRTHGTALQTDGRSIVPTPDGGFLIGGLGYGNMQYDSYVAKVDSTGNLLWQHYLGSPTLDGVVARVAVLPDGTYLAVAAAGVRPTTTQFYLRYRVYRFDATGRQLSARSYGPIGNADVYSVQPLADGSVVIAGQQTDTTAQAKPVAVVFKLCANGDSVWRRTYKILQGPDSHHYLTDLRPTPDGGFVASGFLFTSPPDTGASDGWVFKIDSAGYLQPGGPPVTVQCRLTGLPETGVTTPEVELYPNPTLPDGRFTIEAPPGATLTLTDALGREVWRTGILATRNSQLVLPRSGLYLLRLTWPDGRTLTRKLVR